METMAAKKLMQDNDSAIKPEAYVQGASAPVNKDQQ